MSYCTAHADILSPTTQQGICPTPGCTGIGHIKGAKYTGHHRLLNIYTFLPSYSRILVILAPVFIQVGVVTVAIERHHIIVCKI